MCRSWLKAEEAGSLDAPLHHRYGGTWYRSFYEEIFVRSRTVLIMLVSSFLLGLTPLFADSVIQRGADVFTTP